MHIRDLENKAVKFEFGKSVNENLSWKGITKRFL